MYWESVNVVGCSSLKAQRFAFKTAQMPHRTRSKSRPPSSSSSSGIIIESTACSDDVAQTERPESLDKENVKNSAFQPPSPLTSRRSKHKPSTAKKILSPTRNSQWSRSRESSSASMQPRSSPIHTGHSFLQVRVITSTCSLGAPFFNRLGGVRTV